MSDFDKEAEREKLREQLEEEEESRKHTQQMSELLLKGATMTNAHCDNCGDPIFRYDGQEFCPTCQTGNEAGGGANGQPSAASAEQPTEQSNATDRQSPDPTTADTADDGAAASAETGAPADASVAPGRPSASDGQHTTGSAAAPQNPDPTTAGTSVDGDVAAAAEALRATLTKFSRKAAETDDPARAREYLAAAREAAEALDALPY
ncbi:Sjogren's syndrome/scleroderma autoantigen 1 family protein [Halostella salina]|uniref:Sjogren's syndrome/scleroderma autoantigen 1 family protein n=1 Tax=Halostella salina TaxID=1547897 RepID=UPI000EF7E3DB|nr:Sjogren's syndrome/scleroderma autoantigen 1 family protein [Halostella salina]